MTHPIYEVGISYEELVPITERALSEEDQCPITHDEHLDIDQTQRLGELTGEVLCRVDLDGVSLLRSRIQGLQCTLISVEDYRDGEGSLDGLQVVPYLDLDLGQGPILMQKASTILVDRISRSNELGGHAQLTQQVTAFTLHLLGRVAQSLNEEVAFYSALARQTLIEKETRHG